MTADFSAGFALLLVPGRSRSFGDSLLTNCSANTNGPTLNPNATFAISGISGLTNYYCLGDSISPSVICTNTPGTNETDIFDDDCNETNIYDSCSASSLGGTNNTWSFSLGTFSTNGTGTSIPTMALTNYGAGTVSFHMGWTNTCTTNTGSVDTNATFFVVQLNSLDVAGATQIGPSTNNDWGAVKTNDYVILTANMNTSDIGVSNLVHWSGDGQAVPGNPLQWEVSKTNSLKYTVTVSCCSTSYTANVWIIWATVSIQTTRTTPTNAVQFGSAYDGTENLGGKTFAGGTSGVGKVVPIAQLTPVGINHVITSGWAFKRDRIGRAFFDGGTILYETAWTHDLTPDGKDGYFQNLIPDSDDKIYDRDAPNIQQFGASSCSEKYGIFRQWIEWNGTPASEQYSSSCEWYHSGRWKASASPQIIQNDVGAGNPTLPTTAAGCN